MPAQEPNPAPPVQSPITYGGAQMDYQDYLKVQELLQLQRPQSKPPHHDEMLFIIIHQAYELWFKLILHELEQTIKHVQDGRVEAAHHHTKRVVSVMELLVKQIHLLETMKPVDFLQFRDHLKPASGFQSVQFREIEFLVGLKERSYLKFLESRPNLVRRLRRRLKEQDLGEAFVELLARLNYPVPAQRSNAAIRSDSTVTTAVARSLVRLYQRPDEDMMLYLLCERLLELDEVFSLWRNHHVHVVERIIGSKPGTGGSSGVPYLRTTTGKRAFPFLWEVRTLLEMPSTTPTSVDVESPKKGRRVSRRS